MPKIGRPTKCTDEVTAKVIEALGFGCTRRDAAHFAGIDQTSMSRWLASGAKPQSRTCYKSFLLAVIEAEAKAKVQAVGFVYKAAEQGDWKAAAWWLERKFPAEWSKHVYEHKLEDPELKRVAKLPLSTLVKEVQGGVSRLGGLVAEAVVAGSSGNGNGASN